MPWLFVSMSPSVPVYLYFDHITVKHGFEFVELLLICDVWNCQVIRYELITPASCVA